MSELKFRIDPSSPVPIYRQIVEQIRHSIASGVLRAGDRIPSVRQMAVDLTVNHNTVAKAYRALEAEKVIKTKTGEGTFVADEGAVITKRERLRLVDEQIESLLVRAYHLDITGEEVASRLKERIKRFEKGGK